MRISLEDILLADCNIIEMTVDLDGHSVVIISERSYYIPDKKILGKTKLIITQWIDLTVRKFISHEPGQGVDVVLNNNQVETFMLIQEIVVKDNFIGLNGFSKQSHDWMMYEFVGSKIEVEQAF